MLVEMLQGKIHRASVTDCRLDYEGSLTVDDDLIEQAGLRVYQKVQVLNINNGQRIETYLISGERFAAGDQVITRINDHPASRLGELLPWHWSRVSVGRSLAA